MPHKSQQIIESLGLNYKQELTKKMSDLKKWGGLPPGLSLPKANILFPRLDIDVV